ncbi:MAG TPA: AIM24 family protein [Sporichthyaceae bacterium]
MDVADLVSDAGWRAAPRIRDSPGELVVLPLHPEMEIDVRGHAFLVGTHSISYSYVRVDGYWNKFRGGIGMFLDHFVTTGEPGLLMLHGSGNLFERRPAAGQSVLVDPGAFLYKDASVEMELEQQDVKVGMTRNLYLVRMTGPGRLGIRSMFHLHHGGEG